MCCVLFGSNAGAGVMLVTRGGGGVEILVEVEPFFVQYSDKVSQE